MTYAAILIAAVVVGILVGGEYPRVYAKVDVFVGLALCVVIAAPLCLLAAIVFPVLAVIGGLFWLIRSAA